MGSRAAIVVVSSLLLALGAAASCTLDIPDVVVDGGPDVASDGFGTDVVATDGPSEATDAAIVPACEAGACGAPAGFAPVLFAANQNTSCPTTTTTFDGVANPTAGPSACSCDCTVTQQPACDPHLLLHYIDAPDASCGMLSALQVVVDGGCNSLTVGGFVADNWRVDPFPPADAGACTGTATPNPSAVQSTPTRTCVDETCGTCAAPPGFKLCWIASGSPTCPAGTTRSTSGDGVSVACSACSACTLTTQCKGDVHLFGDNLCAVPEGNPVAVDGGCNATGVTTGPPLNAVVYEAGTTSTCAAGTATGSAQLTNPVTICCP